MPRFAILVAAVLSATPIPLFAQQAPADGMSLSVPLKDLKSLLKLDDAPPPIAPVDLVYSPATYVVAADAKSATVTVDADVTFPNKRWVLIPLGSGKGVTSVLLDKKPAAMVQDGGRLVVLVDAREKQSAHLTVTMQLSTEHPGNTTTLTLPLLPAPVASLQATLPQPNLVVRAGDINGLKIGSTAVATTVAGTLPQANSVALTWSAPDERPARVSVQQLLHVIVDRGVVRYQSTLQYDILRSPLRRAQVALPDDVEVTKVSTDTLADYSIDDKAKPRVLTANLKDDAIGALNIEIAYEHRLKDGELSPAAALLAPKDVAAESGFIGVEVRGNYELATDAQGADRIDIAELPAALETAARSPLRYAFRFDKPGAKLGLTLRPLQDMDVLVAMSDISEVSTTVTPEGRVITKMIMIMRNNEKSHLRVTLPEGATLWSALVDDRPVTPAKDDKGTILVPLRKSEAADDDDERSYKNQRDQRREGNDSRSALRQRQAMAIDAHDNAADLKPYDVELVYVSPPVVFETRGDVKLALPKVDVPIGQLSWAVFMPKTTRVLDETGNIREVDSFSLPFTHFGEAGQREQTKAAAVDKAMMNAQASLQQSANALAMAANAKAKGVLPVRIEIPLTGTLYRFEKLLVVDEMPAIDLTYLNKGN